MGDDDMFTVTSGEDRRIVRGTKAVDHLFRVTGSTSSSRTLDVPPAA